MTLLSLTSSFFAIAVLAKDAINNKERKIESIVVSLASSTGVSYSLCSSQKLMKFINLSRQ